jgi:lysine decarboxylase
MIHHTFPLDECEGKVAAEPVEIYPPGIPIIIEGFRVTREAIGYLKDVRETLPSKTRPASTVVARDTTLDTLRVV